MTSTDISEFLGRTTFHGFRDLYDSRKNKVLLSIWFLSMMVAFLFCGYCCYRVWAQYDLEPNRVTLHYMSKSREFTPQSFQIPEILTCSNRVLNYDVIKQWCGIDSELIRYYLSLSYYDPRQIVNEINKINWGNRYQLRRMSSRINKTNKCLQSRNLSYSQALWATTRECEDIFSGKVMSHSGDTCNCNTCKLRRILTKHGACFLLDDNAHDYWLESGFEENMMWVVFNGAFEAPLTRMKVKSKVEIIVTQKCYLFAPNTLVFSSCNAKQSVRYSECLGECVFGYSMQKCRCRLVDTYVYNESLHLPICSFSDIFFCFAALETSKETTKARYWRCEAKCKLCSFCTSQVSAYDWPLPSLKFNLSNIIIRLPSEYTSIEEVPPKSWEQFVAEIGGQFSLWIGGSILSVVQLTVFGIRYCYQKCSARNRRNTVESIQIDLS